MTIRARVRQILPYAIAALPFVLAPIGIGAFIDLLVVPDIASPVDEVARTAAVRRLARSASAIAILVAIVPLLTAAAQAS